MTITIKILMDTKDLQKEFEAGHISLTLPFYMELVEKYEDALLHGKKRFKVGHWTTLTSYAEHLIKYLSYKFE